jgi:hypothetical protein
VWIRERRLGRKGVSKAGGLGTFFGHYVRFSIHSHRIAADEGMNAFTFALTLRPD